MKRFLITSMSLALSALLNVHALAQTDGKPLDFTNETNGADSRAFSSITGKWNIDQDGSKRVYAVDGRKWANGIISSNVADKAKGLYGERYAEFLDNLEAFKHYPLAVFRETSDFRNGVISVSFKGVSGRIDQAAGIAFNIKRSGDYLVIRANCLENNLVLWSMVRGKRSSVEWIRNVPTPSLQWHTLKVVINGAKVEGYLDDKKYIEYTHNEDIDGRIGLWSKADSYVFFDNFAVQPR